MSVLFCRQCTYLCTSMYMHVHVHVDACSSVSSLTACPCTFVQHGYLADSLQLRKMCTMTTLIYISDVVGAIISGGVATRSTSLALHRTRGQMLVVGEVQQSVDHY